MRIDGEWALFDDGVMRPMVSGEILAADGSWVKFPFLVDTGADRTVLTAAALTQLGVRPNTLNRIGRTNVPAARGSATTETALG